MLIDASGDCTGADVASVLRSSKSVKKGREKTKKPATSERQKTPNIPFTWATERELTSLDQQTQIEDNTHGSSLRKDDISLIVLEVLKELRKDSSEGSTPTEASDDATPGKSCAVSSIIMCISN